MHQPANPLLNFQTTWALRGVFQGITWPRDRIARAKPKIDSEDPGADEAENVEGDEREEERTWRDATVTQLRCQPCHGPAVGNAVLPRGSSSQVFARSLGLGSRAEVYDGELAGLLLGASKAMALARNDPRIKHIHIFADNTSAIKTIFDPKPRSGQLYSHVFHKKICAFLDDDPERKVEIAWSPGHCDIDGNERADTLAKMGAEMATEAGGTRSHALHKAKEKVQKSWVKEWKAAPKTGNYAIANRFPPSLKPTPHFKSLKREVFGRVTQCRIGHCFSGEYYSRFVPSENVNCPCGEEFQTREHILRVCPRYEDQRHILRSVSRDISLPEILGTKDGITALAKFLEESGAFTKTGTPRRPQELPLFDDEPDPGESDDESDDGG
ncbi:RnaseH domain transposon factor [Mycena venus]|uniref:RnaseH domain transposon factor n=1 Tax=Mycena venus TaxID=2733690 RepID=A0A8H7CBK6_9AGAR|nr:RnaseH domain transposon factor [Mycena venus]